MNRVLEIFEDTHLVEKIQKRLPYLFQIAEIETTRGSKTGMEVGCLREQIIVALLMYKFGEENVRTPKITQAEVDVELFGQPLSIKAKKEYSNIKVKWTVNGIKAREFLTEFSPRCGLLLAHVRWGKRGGFYYIPLTVQQEVFEKIGPHNYIKLPKPGTNPRGIEIRNKAMKLWLQHPETRSIPIEWRKADISYTPYQRWLSFWREE